MNTSNQIRNALCVSEIFLNFSGVAFSDFENNPNTTSVINALGSPLNHYFTKGSFHFSEESKETDAGIVYLQRLSFSFNPSDEYRIQRLKNLHRVQSIILKLNDGTSLIVGRNDYNQNRKLKVTTLSTLTKTSAEFTCESMQPISQFSETLQGTLPAILPIFNI